MTRHWKKPYKKFAYHEILVFGSKCSCKHTTGGGSSEQVLSHRQYWLLVNCNILLHIRHHPPCLFLFPSEGQQASAIVGHYLSFFSQEISLIPKTVGAST